MPPTTFGLAALIATAIALQVAGLALVALYRQAAEHRAALARLGAPAPDSSPAEAEEPVEPTAWRGARPLRVVAIVVEDAAEAVRSFHLESADGAPLPAFRPGQFLTFHLDLPVSPAHPAAALVRCYSLSDAPGGPRYRVTVKRVPPSDPDVPPGRVSNHLHEHLRVGDVLSAQAPRGHFVLGDGVQPIVLIAGGIGVTPLLSMAKHSVTRNPSRAVYFFYGVRSANECALLGELEALRNANPNFHLHLCLSAPAPGDLNAVPDAVAGRVDIQRLRLSLPAGEQDFYLCGPAPMLEGLVPALRAWGVAERRLHFETFGPSSVARPAEVADERAASSPSRVRFARSGKTVAWAPRHRSLLDLADAHGVAVASGCRSGSCGSCQTPIESGEVGYARPPDYDPDPGTCLLCVARPHGDLTLSA